MEDTAPTVTNDNVSKDVPATPTKYRSSAYRGNARGLGKHEKQTGEDNYTMLQGFEWHSAAGGQFWNEFKKKTSELGSMGITAVWLPPPTKASSPEGNGYDIYDLYDLGEFETYGGDNKSKATKWGTKEEYISAIEEAKKNGMVVYVDAVLNHKAGADTKEKFMATEVDSEDRTKEISDCYEIEGWTGFHFPGRGDKYSEMKWHHYHFTGVDYDARGEKTAIFKIQGEGKDWAEGVDKEKGSFDYLMFSDIDHSHPEVIADLEKWGEWILKETGAGGFRFDAIKHIDETFCSNFVKAIRERLDNEDVFAVGEFWLDNVAALTGYLDRFDTQFSIFDTPLHYNFAEASSAGASFDLRKIFDGSLVQARPMDAVTIVDNHDTQPGEALESFVGSGFKPLAYSLILFRNDGYPCVFEGDLYGCKSDPPVEPMHQLSDFIRIRKLFTYGATRDYWDHPNCVGWVREGDKDHDGCAIVICNGTGEGEKRMQIPDGHAGEVWTDVLGWFEGEVVIGEDGWADFKCPASSVSVWVNKDARGREEFRVGDMELEKGVEELKI